MIHVWYNWRVVIGDKSHSEFWSRLIEWKILIVDATRFSTCVLNVSFRSIHIFSHLNIFWGFNIVSFDHVIALVYMNFFDSKWINLDFESSNLTAFWSTHKNAMLTISISVLQLILIHFDIMLIWILSIKLNELIFAFIRILRNKKRIYIKNRIDNIDDSCKISVRMLRVCYLWPSNASWIDQLYTTRKINWTESINVEKNPPFWTLLNRIYL